MPQPRRRDESNKLNILKRLDVEIERAMKTRPRKRDGQVINYLRSKPAAKAHLHRLLQQERTDNVRFFSPRNIEEIDLHRAFVALKIVIPIEETFRLSLEGRVKDGFIECRLSPSARRLYAKAFPKED